MTPRLARSHTRLALLALAVATNFPTGAAVAKPTFKIDPGGTRVVEMANMAPTNYACAAGGTKQGRVAEREVNQVDNRLLHGFFLAGDDAVEYYVEPPTDGISDGDLKWLIRGYETLLKTGSNVRIAFKMCEVAGTKSPYLDNVR